MEKRFCMKEDKELSLKSNVIKMDTYRLPQIVEQQHPKKKASCIQDLNEYTCQTSSKFLIFSP